MGLEEKIKEDLDKIAKGMEKTVERYFPGAKFRFTHEEYWIYKRTISIENGFPITDYSRVSDLSELTSKSYLLVIASVKAFNRKQIALVRCSVQEEDGKLGLIRTDEPVEVLDTEFSHEEEAEKKEKGLVNLPRWVSEYQHEIIGLMITIVTDVALKYLGL